MQFNIILYNYKKFMTTTMLIVIPCILLGPIIIFTTNNLNEELTLILLLFSVSLGPIAILLSLKIQSSKETVELKQNLFVSKKFGEIEFNSIEKVKFDTYKATRIRLYLKSGLVIGISPTSQFSSKASHVLNELHKELMKKNGQNVISSLK